MVVSDIDRITVRTPDSAVQPARAEIHIVPDNRSVVVVVAGHRVHFQRQFLLRNHLVGIVHIEIELVPENVVGQISQIHHIDWTVGLRSLFPDERNHSFTELPDVILVRIIAKMQVRKEKHGIPLLILSEKFEIVPFHLVRRLGQTCPETGPEPILRNRDRIRRSRYKYHTVSLFTVNAVFAFAVSQDNVHAVADLHSGKRLSVDGDLASDIAGLRTAAARDNDKSGQDIEKMPFHQFCTAVLGLPIRQTAVEMTPAIGHHQLHAM